MTWLVTAFGWLKTNWRMALLIVGTVIVITAGGVIVKHCSTPSPPPPPKELEKAAELHGQSVVKEQLGDAALSAAAQERDEATKLLTEIDQKVKAIEEQQRKIEKADLDELDDVFRQHGY